MTINKVIFGGETLVDLTNDTVSTDTLAKGVTAHDKTGVQITGTMESGGSEKYGATVDNFLGDVDASGVLQAPTAQTDLVFDGVTDIGANILQYFAYGNKYINSASFPNLTQITGNDALYRAFYSSSIRFVSFPVLQSLSGATCLANAFSECKSLQSIEFPSLVSISGIGALQYMCYYSRDAITSISFPVLKEITGNQACERMADVCGKLTSIQFPLLETVTGNQVFRNAFSSCQKLKSILFPKLKTIGSSTATSNNYGQFSFAFYSTPEITSLEFPELTEIYCTGTSTSAGTFYSNNIIQKMYFPKLTVIDKSPACTGTAVAQNYIFSNCSKLTEIHFGAANQAAIEASSGYPTLWGRGAGNATVYFDL